MENKNILLLKHHPMNVLFTNTFYTNQTENDLKDYLIFDVTSRIERNKEFMKEHPTFAKDLSPFRIGPVTSSDGVVSHIFEIFWQCGKVYPCHDNNGAPNDDYFKWRNYYYGQEVCTKDLMRHTCKSLGYEHKDTLYFAYYDKELKKYVPLNYVQARKKVYFVEYAKCIYQSESFKFLKSLVDSGKKIALVDFDGYNYNEICAKMKLYDSYLNKCKTNNTKPIRCLNDFLKINSMKDAVNCDYLLAGHGFVIKALLQGDIKIENNQVIDVAGILN